MGDLFWLLRIYAIRPNLMCARPFLMVQILNPCPAELLSLIFITVTGLKNQTNFAIQIYFEESANLLLPQDFYNINIIEN